MKSVQSRKDLILPVTILAVVLFTAWYVFSYGQMNPAKIIPWMIVMIIPCSIYWMWNKNVIGVPSFVFPVVNLVYMSIAVIWDYESWTTDIWVQKIVNILLMWLTLTALTIIAKRFAAEDRV